jgi:hypothetical protein
MASQALQQLTLMAQAPTTDACLEAVEMEAHALGSMHVKDRVNIFVPGSRASSAGRSGAGKTPARRSCSHRSRVGSTRHLHRLAASARPE